MNTLSAANSGFKPSSAWRPLEPLRSDDAFRFDAVLQLSQAAAPPPPPAPPRPDREASSGSAEARERSWQGPRDVGGSDRSRSDADRAASSSPSSSDRDLRARDDQDNRPNEATTSEAADDPHAARPGEDGTKDAQAEDGGETTGGAASADGSEPSNDESKRDPNAKDPSARPRPEHLQADEGRLAEAANPDAGEHEANNDHKASAGNSEASEPTGSPEKGARGNAADSANAAKAKSGVDQPESVSTDAHRDEASQQSVDSPSSQEDGGSEGASQQRDPRSGAGEAQDAPNPADSTADLPDAAATNVTPSKSKSDTQGEGERRPTSRARRQAAGGPGDSPQPTSRDQGPRHPSQHVPSSPSPTIASPTIASPTLESTASEMAATGRADEAAPATGETTSRAEPSPIVSGSDPRDPSRPLARTAQAANEASTGRTTLSGPDANRFGHRVTRALEMAHQRGEPLQIRLSPPELGSLRIEISVRGGVLTAHLEADTGAARNALLDHLPTLREKLAEQDIRIERFDVDVREESGGPFQERSAAFQDPRRSPSGGTRSMAAGDAPADEQPPDPAPRAAVRIGDGQLNLVV